MTDKTDKKNVTLTVGFDIDQVTDALAYHFHSRDHAHPNPLTGLFAGEIYFCTGEIFHLRVKGGGAIDGFSSFQVVDCCIVTRPRVIVAGPDVTTRHAAPSPFLQVLGACYQFPLDFSSDVKDDQEQQYRVITQHWKRTLDVSHSHGQWDLSFTLTVRIQRGPLLEPEIRVFYFDPEGQVGPGGGED
jgi:hypothetical protein